MTVLNIMEHIDERFDYANMYNWTNDLPQNSIGYFHTVIDYINQKDYKKRILEIGTFAGISAIKLTELIKNSEITVIDSWENYNEIGGTLGTVDQIEENNIEQIFYRNIEISGLKDLFTVRKGNSFDVLLSLIKNGEMFDVIYVDGSHTLLDSYTDIVLSFELLNKNGVLIIDDVAFNSDDILNSPLDGIKYFAKKNEKRIKILHSGYRLFLEKL